MYLFQVITALMRVVIVLIATDIMDIFSRMEIKREF